MFCKDKEIDCVFVAAWAVLLYVVFLAFCFKWPALIMLLLLSRTCQFIC